MASTRQASRLVGRAAELSGLDAELRLARAGELRVVLLLGEPGMGKSRLAREFLARHSGPDLRIRIEDLIGEGDRVAWRLTVKGTHEAELMGIPASGVEVEFSGQYIFRFRNGKIVERWTNFDRHGVMTQLGAVPVMQA